jgi:hypothetical protein
MKTKVFIIGHLLAALSLFGQNGTPVGGKTAHMYYYKNSLYNHLQTGSNQGNASTAVGNWIARFSAAAPIPNTVSLGSMFGFFTQWVTPAQANQFHSELTTTLIAKWTPSWNGAQNINHVGFVPDNFDGYNFDPSVNTNMGMAYETRLLNMIDAWEANAPNSNRKYVVYAGWPQMNNGFGGSGGNPATITPAQLANWRNFGLGSYQTWMELLVAKLKTARPNLDIRLHNISKAVLMTHANTNVGNIPLTTLFEDLAPHGRSTWYCLAAIAEYIELFNEKPSATFTFNPTWNVDPVVTNNYQQIVDYMWTVLKGNTVTSINKNTDDSQFSVFPNPAQNQLYVLTNESDFEIEITNLLGQSVLKIKNNPQLDVSQLTKGSYLLNYKGKKTITKKIFITE